MLKSSKGYIYKKLLVITVLLNILALINISHSAIAEPGNDLVAYYSFDNQDASDTSGYKNHGRIYGTTWTSQGKVHGAYEFNGVEDYIAVADNPSLNFGTLDFSIAAWGYHNNDDYPRSIFPFKKSDGNCHGGGIGWWLGGEGRIAEGIRYCFRDNFDNTTGPATLNLDFPAANLLNQWVHIVYVVDRVHGKLKIYINGVKQQQEGDISQIKGSISSSGDFLISDTQGWRMGGILDEIMVFRRALSDNEIQNVYLNNLSLSTEIPSQNNSDSTPNPLMNPLTSIIICLNAIQIVLTVGVVLSFHYRLKFIEKMMGRQ